jgi:hypothetical protein
MLRNKEPKRPFQDLSGEKVRWYTDNNEILINVASIKVFIEYVVYEFNEEPFIGPLKPSLFDYQWIPSPDIIRLLEEPYFALWLIWLNLPKSVEDVLINNYNELRKHRIRLKAEIEYKVRRINGR